MAKRVITKIGDVFSAPINEHEKKYFQLIAFDLTQLYFCWPCRKSGRLPMLEIPKLFCSEIRMIVKPGLMRNRSGYPIIGMYDTLMMKILPV
jgi:hypothetical protein